MRLGGPEVEDRGLAGFLVCKIGVALAAVTFLGAVLSMYASLGRIAGRDELGRIADAIAGAVETSDSMPGEVEMVRDLPKLTDQFDVMIVGERSGGVQTVRVRVSAEAEVERVLTLSSEVNGGEFTLTAKNPMKIHLRKFGAIQLELI